MIKINDSFIRLPSRESITNKGDAGKVLIIGGDVGMCGAVAFACESAYRMGCGLVRAIVHTENRIPLQTLIPEAVLGFWDDDTLLETSLEWADAVVIGVGFGVGEIQKKLLKIVLTECKKPIVIDADGLNILSKSRALMSKISANCVLTPHLVELSRLTGVSVDEIKKDTLGVIKKSLSAVSVAAKSDVTVMHLASGEEYISASGNSSLSTGGTGDVLAGMIASLIAQGMDIRTALPTAVYLHGRAGVKAGERLGERSVIARDVISAICEILKEF
ncbi:MAG: NAD(P)H-hydrate dehydratase [Clostridia bacterium]|nr:NAD(P)H-hydrate dehydratase [Clostridia bacterium]